MGMRLIQVTIEFELGQIVYLKTDEEMKPRMVKGWYLTPDTKIEYELQVSNFEPSMHYGIEIAAELSEVEAIYKNQLE